MKRTGVARAPLRRSETLRDKIEAQLAATKRMPQLVRSFFQAPTVAYINRRIARIELVWRRRLRFAPKVAMIDAREHSGSKCISHAIEAPAFPPSAGDVPEV
jgi:hypothetical protein